VIPPVEATAPGKLVLLGEYAVLEGAPAVVAAVERRARVRVRPADGDRWRIVAPGLLGGAVAVSVGADGGLGREDPDTGGRLAFLDALLRAMVEEGPVDPRRLPPLELELDTTAFFDRDDPARPKLGLGSSAALTVALATALAATAAAGSVPETEGGWLPALVGLHRRAQGGRGSGIDVAASLLGGILRYRLGPGGQPEAAPVTLPPGVHLRFVWTGLPTGTAGFLVRLERALADGGGGTRRRLDALAGLARRGVEALEAERAGAFLEVVDAYREGMAALGREAGIPILGPEHERLAAMAADLGISYKPSGAGGGDFGVGLTTDPAALDRFVRSASDAGFAVPDLAIAREGAVLDVVSA